MKKNQEYSDQALIISGERRRDCTSHGGQDGGTHRESGPELAGAHRPGPTIREPA